MNWFKLYIGDYQRDTAHLTVTEHGAYLLMLQHYYATEKPLPVGKSLHRMLRAQDKAEREAIDAVAAQFWTVTDAGLVNHRADRELQKAGEQADTNRAIALAREAKRKAARTVHGSCADREDGGHQAAQESGGKVSEKSKKSSNCASDAAMLFESPDDAQVVDLHSDSSTNRATNSGTNRLTNDQPNQTPDTRHQTNTTPHTPRKRGSASPAGFDVFWSAYPRKTAKASAERAFAKLAPSADLLDEIVSAAKAQACWPAWLRDGGQFIPHAATWLNGKRWNDAAPVLALRFESDKARAARESVEAMTGGLVSIRPPRAAQHQEADDGRSNFLALG